MKCFHLKMTQLKFLRTVALIDVERPARAGERVAAVLSAAVAITPLRVPTAVESDAAWTDTEEANEVV